MEEDERKKTAGSGGDGEAAVGGGRSSPSTPINPTSSSSTDNVDSINNNNSNDGDSPLHHRHQILTVPIVDGSNGNSTLYLDFDDDSDDDGGGAIHGNVNSSFHHHHNTITTISSSGDDTDGCDGGHGHGHEEQEDIEDTLYYDDLAPRSSLRYRINSSIRLCYRRLWACPKCLWHYIQSSRSKARQRRADIILWERSYGVGGDEDGDDNENVLLRTRDWKRSTMLCFSASCDDTDSGIIVLVVFVVVWGLLLWLLGGFPTVQKNILIGGAVFLVFRICSRPFWEYVQRLYYRRRGGSSRSAQRIRSQPIPQHSPPPPSGKKRISTSSIFNDQRSGHDGDGEDDDHNNFRTSLELSSSLSTSNDYNSKNNNVHRLFRPESPSSEGEEGSSSNLPGIFMTGSEESDPAIAAI